MNQLMLPISPLPDLPFSWGVVAGVVISAILYFLQQSVRPLLSYWLQQKRDTESTIDEWCADALVALGKLERQHTRIGMLKVDGGELSENYSPIVQELLSLANGAPEGIGENLKEWLIDIAAGHDSIIVSIEEGETVEQKINRDKAAIPIERVIEQLLIRTVIAKKLVRQFRKERDDVSSPEDVLTTLGLAEDRGLERTESKE